MTSLISFEFIMSKSLNSSYAIFHLIKGLYDIRTIGRFSKRCHIKGFLGSAFLSVVNLRFAGGTPYTGFYTLLIYQHFHLL